MRLFNETHLVLSLVLEKHKYKNKEGQCSQFTQLRVNVSSRALEREGNFLYQAPDHISNDAHESKLERDFSKEAHLRFGRVQGGRDAVQERRDGPGRHEADGRNEGHCQQTNIVQHNTNNKEKGRVQYMTEIFRFYPEGDTLFVEVLGNEYLKNQPSTPSEAEVFAQGLRPIVAQVEDYIRTNKLREVMILNLKGVGLAALNPQTTTQLVNLLYTIRSDDEVLLDRIEIQNSNPIFEMFYKQVKKNLPPGLVSMIQFV